MDSEESKLLYFEVVITASNGSIAFSASETMLFSSVYSSSSSHVLLLVPASGLSKALVGLEYTPLFDFYGSDIINIEVDDLGNSGLCYSDDGTTGSECSLKASYRLPVVVAMKDDTIEIDSSYKDRVTMCEEGGEVVVNGIRVLHHDIRTVVKSDVSRYVVRDSSVNRSPVTNDFAINKRMNSSNYTFTEGFVNLTYSEAMNVEEYYRDVVSA